MIKALIYERHWQHWSLLYLMLKLQFLKGTNLDIFWVFQGSDPDVYLFFQGFDLDISLFFKGSDLDIFCFVFPRFLPWYILLCFSKVLILIYFVLFFQGSYLDIFCFVFPRFLPWYILFFQGSYLDIFWVSIKFKIGTSRLSLARFICLFCWVISRNDTYCIKVIQQFSIHIIILTQQVGR